MSKIGKKPIYISSNIRLQKKESQLILKNPVCGEPSAYKAYNKQSYNKEPQKKVQDMANNTSLKVNLNLPLTVVFKKSSGADLQVLALASLKNKEGLLHKKKKSYNTMWGTFRAQLFNTVRGLYKFHTIRFKFVGVGFKANLKKDFFILRLGFSHRLFFRLPAAVGLSQTKKRPPTFLLKSNDLDLIKNTAFILRAFKKPEPYKGKGIVLVNEQIKLKEGKKV